VSTPSNLNQLIPANKPRRPSAPILIAGFVILIALIAGGIYFIHKSISKPAVTTYSYTYHKLVTSTLAGTGVSHGLVFQRPVEFTAIAPEGRTDIASFAQTVNKKGVVNTVGGETAVASPAPANYNAIINYYFSLPDTSSGYKSATSSIRDFLQSQEMPYIFFSEDKNPKIDLNLGHPAQDFTSNLPGGVWIFSYTATDTNLKSDKQKISVVRGELIFAIGKSDYYYLLLGTDDYNWLPNQPILANILSGLKIDQ